MRGALHCFFRRTVCIARQVSWPLAQERQDSLPRAGQRREDHPAAHAERRQGGYARPYAASTLGRACHLVERFETEPLSDSSAK